MATDYLSDLSVVFWFLVSGTGFIVITLYVSRALRPSRPGPEKLSTYESGEEPVTSAWTQFNLKFYVVAIVFLLFEAELIFLFPWSLVFADKALIEGTNGSWGWFAFIEMMIFIGILVIGLAYAWRNGHLDWIKPEQKLPDYKSPVPERFYEEINRKYKR